MDYECDFGFSRQEGSGTCERRSYLKDADADKAYWDTNVVKRQEEQCEEHGYYEVS